MGTKHFIQCSDRNSNKLHIPQFPPLGLKAISEPLFCCPCWLLRSYLLWDVETTSSFLLLGREVVSQRSPGSGIRAVLGVLALVIQHLQLCYLLLRLVTFSAEDQQEEPLGRHKFLCLRVRQCCPCMKESPQTSCKVHQRYHCDAAAIDSCQVPPMAPVYLLSPIPSRGILTSTATWQETTGLWNSNLSSEPCRWEPDSLVLVQHLIILLGLQIGCKLSLPCRRLSLEK